MTAIVLPDIDLGALRKAIPGLTEIDLPSMQEAGKRADEAVDQLLGRSRPPIMPLLALGVILIALSGWAAALFTWRRSDSTIANAPTSDHDPLGMKPSAGF